MRPISKTSTPKRSPAYSVNIDSSTANAPKTWKKRYRNMPMRRSCTAAISLTGGGISVRRNSLQSGTANSRGRDSGRRNQAKTQFASARPATA